MKNRQHRYSKLYSTFYLFSAKQMNKSNVRQVVPTYLWLIRRFRRRPSHDYSSRSILIRNEYWVFEANTKSDFQTHLLCLLRCDIYSLKQLACRPEISGGWTHWFIRHHLSRPQLLSICTIKVRMLMHLQP